MKHVTLYTKPGCHLCDVMKSVVQDVAARHAFGLDVRNILDDPADLEKYRTAVPVLLVDGKETARYRLTAKELEAALSG